MDKKSVMNNEIGKSIIDYIKELPSGKVSINEVEGSFKVLGDGYVADVVIKPPKELSLIFTLLDSQGKPELSYSIDNDLYDMSSPSNSKFAQTIEERIVNILHQLEGGYVKRGTRKGRPALLIPTNDGLTAIYRGWFATTVKEIKNIDLRQFNNLKALQL